MRDLGSRAAMRVGSSPFRRTSSSQATYRLRRAFSFHDKAHRALILLLHLSAKSRRSAAVALRNAPAGAVASKPDPLSLGSGLGPPLRGGFFLTLKKGTFNHPLHVGASFVSLAPTFFKSQSALAAPGRQAGRRLFSSAGSEFFSALQHFRRLSCISGRTAKMQFKGKLCNRKGRLLP